MHCARKGRRRDTTPPLAPAPQQEDIRQGLAHLAETTDKTELRRLVRKCRSVPDRYHSGEHHPVGPGDLCNRPVLQKLGLSIGTPTVAWELCASSTTLSAQGRKAELSHLPPLGYSWGHHLGRARDQCKA